MRAPSVSGLLPAPRRFAVVAAVVALLALVVVTATTPLTRSAFTAQVTNSLNVVSAASTCAIEYGRTDPAAAAVYPLTDAVALLTAADTSGNNRTATYAVGASLLHSTANACVRDTGGSTTFATAKNVGGITVGSLLVTPNTLTDPQRFTVEIWFQTKNAHGMLVGFNASTSATASGEDRHVYLDSSGRVVFGVGGSANRKTVRSAPGYADGAWHQAAATYDSSSGLVLYVDGKSVDSLSGAFPTAGNNGSWRVGLGDLSGWPGSATPYAVDGQLGQVGIWTSVLPATTIARHYDAGS